MSSIESQEDSTLLIEDEEPDNESVDVTYDIATYPSDYTLSGIAQMWKDGDIEIPDYQREFVWSINQASLLVDSFLRSLPVPPVFLYIDDQNKNLVIDGQQRILSIVFYMEGYFGHENGQNRRVFRLSGLDKKSSYANKKFSELDETSQRKLKQSVLRAINIKQLSPSGESTSAYHIFERLNTGGTPLKPQEIRNCVFMGQFSNDLRTANDNVNWQKIIGKVIPDKHQKDVELILRIFALTSYPDKYEKPMREFLNRAMRINQSGNTPKSKEFFEKFPIICEKIVSELGEKPFHLRRKLNVSALDSVLCCLFKNIAKINEINLAKSFQELKNDKQFDHLTTINTTDPKTLEERFELVEKHLFN